MERSPSINMYILSHSQFEHFFLKRIVDAKNKIKGGNGQNGGQQPKNEGDN